MNNLLQEKQAEVSGDYVSLESESYFRIANRHLMPDFFMSITGSSDHWMFVSSCGALTAGRKNSDFALFPYASDDQIVATRGITGPLTIIKPHPTDRYGEAQPIWRPFDTQQSSNRARVRNIYKNSLGNKVQFEEINESLELSFRYRWTFSEKYGFVRTCHLTNLGQHVIELEILDGIQNVVPYGLEREFLMRFSNLGNAYKKNELLKQSNLGIYYLSSIPTDRAEPSEGLLATTVWQYGLEVESTLLSVHQVSEFIQDKMLTGETDIRGKAGAYLQNATLKLESGESREWITVADVCQSRSKIVELQDWLLSDSRILDSVERDINECEKDLVKIVASSDGIQKSSNLRRTNRHLSNCLFNLMRGGIPLSNYDFPSKDFLKAVRGANVSTYDRNEGFLNSLPETLNVVSLKKLVSERNDRNLTRIAAEYLPLTFGRRHGDPTRPWNHFSIDIRSDDGETNLNYQGNWRDIFQNWEALGVSYPDLLPSMICRFVNATTADGYNPYRVTKDGIEWEEPSPDDPWANIGYWGDHQIVYLLKLMEWAEAFHPELLREMLSRREFVHANIPYRIQSFDEIRKDPQSTIDFDQQLATEISNNVSREGSDAKLLKDDNGKVLYVSLFEKLLTLSLAKLCNFVPDGGIWLNTQRPEWNDANNALVGNGLSMVTTCYLYRWFQFVRNLVNGEDAQLMVSNEIKSHFEEMRKIFSDFAKDLDHGFSPERRSEFVSSVSEAGSSYRLGLYENGIGNDQSGVPARSVVEFLEEVLKFLDVTIRNNRREDGLFHTYNLLDMSDETVCINRLYEMLEGQVAALSSGLLTPNEVAELLNSLRVSKLYREDQNSYLLYPDRELPRFLDKNQISNIDFDSCELLQKLVQGGNRTIVEQDVNGVVHFNGRFRNSSDVRGALADLPGEYSIFAEKDGDSVCGLFEKIFEHVQFTGRSGTFFAYEGLGSIYWHMVSKLGLAVTENLFNAIDAGDDENEILELRQHYFQIRSGIGAEKDPESYGAFPSDPYSHTPENAGVKQPGMTGQVKEDVLARFAEVGIHIDNGCLGFRFGLLDPSELTKVASNFEYVDVDGFEQEVDLPSDSLAFTFCQVPVVVTIGKENKIRLTSIENITNEFSGLTLERSVSQSIFSRDRSISKIECHFDLDELYPKKE